MTIALVVVGVALVAFVVEIMVEVVFELVGQLLFELVVEGTRKLFGLGGRSVRVAAGSTGPSLSLRTGAGRMMWLVAITIGGSFGFWRGSRTDTVTWGLVVAVAVVVVAVIAARRPSRGVEPTSRWRRLVFWWPSDRLYWFATANGSFVTAYLVALLTLTAGSEPM